MGHKQEPLVPRFWKHVQKSDGCWEWTSALNYKGYGIFWRDGRSVFAHRVAWELAHGAPPSDRLVCHRCDNRRCVRADHLFLGTIADNQRDMALKGRALRGVRNHRSKLGPGDIPQIRLLLSRGHHPREIGRRFGVHPVTIRDVAYKRTWAHIPEEQHGF